MPKHVRGRPGLRRRRIVIASGLSAAGPRGVVRLGVLNLPCALGKGGRRTCKREGDGATPIGCWNLVRVLYRADRIVRPVTRLPVKAIGRNDGWCDAPTDRNYNRLVRLPYEASAESLWRTDHLYDVVVVLTTTRAPRVAWRRQRDFHAYREGRLRTDRGLYRAAARASASLLQQLCGAARTVSRVALKKSARSGTPGAVSTYRGSGVLEEAARPDGAQASPHIAQ